MTENFLLPTKNPKRKKAKRKWGTPKQRAALKKGQRALAKWRKEQGFKNPRRRRRPVRRRRPRAQAETRRAAPRRTVATRRRVVRARAPTLFHVREGRRYFTGSGFSTAPGNAAFFKSKAQAARAARALSNKIRRPVGVYG